VLEIVCATRTLKYRDIIYLTTWITLHSDYLARLQAAQCLLLFHFAVNCCVLVLVWCVAVNIMFLLTTFKECAGNVLLLLTNKHCIWETCCALHVEVLLLKLKTLRPECFLSSHLQCEIYCHTFILLIHHRYNLHGFRSGEWGGQNPLLVVLLPRTLFQQYIWIVCIVSCCIVLMKQGIGSPVTGQVFIVTVDVS